MFKRIRLVWADKIVLVMALFIAGAAFLFWILGIVGLEGRPHLRFDNAMINWTIEAELALVPSIWLLLRLMDFGARAMGRLLRSNLRHMSSGELHAS